MRIESCPDTMSSQMKKFTNLQILSYSCHFNIFGTHFLMQEKLNFQGHHQWDFTHIKKLPGLSSSFQTTKIAGKNGKHQALHDSVIGYTWLKCPWNRMLPDYQLGKTSRDSGTKTFCFQASYIKQQFYQPIRSLKLQLKCHPDVH